jgi:hypothetical protein
MTPEERQQLRAVLKLVDQAYAELVKIARPHGQEPHEAMTSWSGWRGDTADDDAALYWEGRKREK